MIIYTLGLSVRGGVCHQKKKGKCGSTCKLINIKASASGVMKRVHMLLLKQCLLFSYCCESELVLLVNPFNLL